MIDLIKEPLLIFPFYSEKTDLERDLKTAMRDGLKQTDVREGENHSSTKYTNLFVQGLNEPMPEFSTAALAITSDAINLNKLFNYSIDMKNTETFKKFVGEHDILRLQKNNKVYSTAEKNRLILLDDQIQEKDTLFILIPKHSLVSGAAYQYASSLIREEIQGILYYKVKEEFPSTTVDVFPINKALTDIIHSLEPLRKQIEENRIKYKSSEKIFYDE